MTKSLSVFQHFIHLSRYARYIPEKGRRETWEETVARYFDFFEEFLQTNNGYTLTKKLREELETAVLQMQLVPSMRCLMTAGEALRLSNIAGYNCLGGDTLVTTLEYGIVPISQLEDKNVHVIDGDGNWTLSKCSSHGSQDLYEIELATPGGNSSNFKIKATDNHQWFEKNKEPLLTKDLLPGMKLLNGITPNRAIIDSESEDYKKGVIHGIVYGDGQAVYKQRSGGRTTYIERTCQGFAIRICGTSRSLVKYFDQYNIAYPRSYKGDPFVYISDRAVDLKDLPDVESDFYTDDYLVGFIRGWLAADGSVTTIGGQVSLASDLYGKQWIYRYGPRLGFYPTSDHVCTSVTKFDRHKDVYNIYFDRRWLNKDDFLLDYKAERFKKIDPSRTAFGQILNVKYCGKEKVYCFNVPTTHSFMLTKNLITGNCSYISIDNTKTFGEIMFILMNGVGVGFTVESQYTDKLPDVPEELTDSDTVIHVADSRLGWAKALNELISLLYSGNIPKWNVSKVRPAGSVLKTFGGRASGPEPLESLFRSVVKIFKAATGRKLTTLECHDIVCFIGDAVVAGGARRSATISLSDLTDDRMRNAKTGAWWNNDAQRSIANNSAVYNERTPSVETFMSEWKSLYDSKSGERGIFSRYAAKAVVNRLNDFRSQHFGDKKGIRYRDPNHKWGTNPCSEIILRDKQFCNLSEVVVRSSDTLEDLKQKVRLATILGTFQSCLTNFKFIEKKWKNNTEDEMLLGVSLTGIMDNQIMSGKKGTKILKEYLTELRKVAIQTNLEFATAIGIPMSTAITAIKPSGTVSQLVDSASGIHTRHSDYYIRTVRINQRDPIGIMLKDQGFYSEPDLMRPDKDDVFFFPIKSPANAITRHGLSAIEQLEIWKIYQLYWCEHKPSVTISVKEEEWVSVGAWVYENFSIASGFSFLPFSDSTYQQMPFTECDKTEYDSWVKRTPSTVDWSKISLYEQEDNTSGSRSLSCAPNIDHQGDGSQTMAEGCML